MSEILRSSEEVAVEDGTRLQLEYFTGAPLDPGSAVVLFLPAMGVEAQYYDPFARELAGQGLRVATADLRAHGRSSVRAGRATQFGYHEMVTRDWKALVETLKRAHPDGPLFLVGHSLGGQLSVLYASRNGADVRGVILVAACSVYYRPAGFKPFDAPGRRGATWQSFTVAEAVKATLAKAGDNPKGWLILAEWAAALKLFNYACIGFALFIPWGVSIGDAGFVSRAASIPVLAAKLAVAGLWLALIETVSAKLRVFRAPEFMASAFMFAVLGLLVHLLLGA